VRTGALGTVRPHAVLLVEATSPSVLSAYPGREVDLASGPCVLNRRIHQDPSHSRPCNVFRDIQASELRGPLVPRRIASPAVAAALCVLLAACGRDPVGKFDNMVEACESAAPGTLAVGSLTAPEAGVIYCAAHDDMDRITSGEVPVEDVAKAVVKLGANDKWYVASS
jgi:hypothetical protein